MLCLVGPDPPDVLQCKPAWSSYLYNWSLKVSWSSIIILMNLAGWWNHAVHAEWQGRREAQPLPGWAAGDVPSSMPRCSPGSLRLIQLLLDCLDCLEMKDRAVCHQHSKGKRNHVLVWWSQWCSVYGEEEGSKNWSLKNPVTSWYSLDTSPPQETLIGTAGEK